MTSGNEMEELKTSAAAIDIKLAELATQNGHLHELFRLMRTERTLLINTLSNLLELQKLSTAGAIIDQEEFKKKASRAWFMAEEALKLAKNTQLPPLGN